MTGRRYWAGLELLDRQLIAHDGRMAGCVDDLELTASDDGNHLYVTAILSGPGALAYRLRWHRLGRWLRRAHASVATIDRPDPTAIPFNLVTELGAHIDIALDDDQVGIASAERWTRDHIIERIPGNRHEPE